MDAAQLASKIIPQCSILLLDKSADVRVLALSLMDQSTARMRQYHEYMLQAGKEGNKDDDNQQNKSSSSSSSSSASMPASGSGMDLNSWTSWSGSMLQGISKTIDQTPSTPTTAGAGSSSSMMSTPSNKQPDLGNVSPGGNNFSSTFSDKVSISKQANKPKPIVKKNEDDWEDFGDDDNSMNHNNSSKNTTSAGAGWGDDLDGALDFDDDDGDKNTYSSSNQNSGKTGPAKKSAFDELDDLNLDDDDDDVYRPPPSASKTTSSSTSSSRAPAIIPPASISSPVTSRPVTSSMSLSSAKPVTSSIATSSLESASSIKAKKTTKIAVKKLEVSKGDDWEDF